MAQMIKNLPVMQEMNLIPGSGRSDGEGTGDPVQYSRLENPMDRGDWQATVHAEFHRRRSLVGYCPWGHKELDTTERLTLSFS